MSKLFRFDKKRASSAKVGVVGIDEAGRGCFAGPVVAGAVWVHQNFYQNSTPVKQGGFINDSKKLEPETRDEVFALIEHWEKAGELIFALGTASIQEIGAFNIQGASRIAMQRAVENLLKKIPAGTRCPFATAGADDAPLFDKGTPFPPMLVDGRPLVPFVWRHEAIVKGDGTSLAIALASIVAKVSRDRMMCEFDKTYPGYNFSTHKGYGTKEHIAAICKLGITPLHRLKFLRHLAATSPEKIRGLEGLIPPEPPNPEQTEFAF